MKYRVTLTTKPGVLVVGSSIILRKQPDNHYDEEAILVLKDGKEVGYAAAFYKIRKLGTYSAGRLLDKIPDTITATVVADQVAEVEVA